MTKLTIKVFGTEIDYEGSEEFLEEKVPLLLDAVRKSQNEEARRTLRDVHEELLQDLVAVERYFANMMQLNEEAAGPFPQGTPVARIGFSAGALAGLVLARGGRRVRPVPGAGRRTGPGASQWRRFSAPGLRRPKSKSAKMRLSWRQS